MARYVVKYAEENYGIITFDAVNKVEAEEWVRRLEMGEIEVEQLFNYSTKVKSASYSLTNLEEVTPPLPEIPIHGIIV
jgi:pentose-5-phosphate-3-epimerase